MKSILIFGGAGFVGKHLIHRLAKKGYKIVVPYQKPTNEAKLRLLGDLGQIIPIQFNHLNDQIIIKLLKTAHICINLKTSWKTKNSNFDESIFEFNQKLLSLVNKNKSIQQFIFFSGLGIDNHNQSLRSKAILKTEKLIFSNFNNAIIIRPGIIIGADDNFLSKLMPIFKISFFIPIFGNGRSTFQPVFIDDVSLVIEKIISNNLKGNHLFELAGSKIFSYVSFYKLISKLMQKKRIIVKIPMFLVKFIVIITEKLGLSPITYEQLILFENDNISKKIDKNFEFFSICPQNIKEIVKKIVINQ